MKLHEKSTLPASKQKSPAGSIDRLLTSVEVAKLLRVDPSSVNNWVRSGKLQSFKTPGGHNRIEATQLRKFLNDTGIPIPDFLRSATPNRLLVVDDDLRELRRWQRQLASMDGLLELRCADNGIEALVQVGAFRPQLVVLDYVMPGLDGIEVCTRLRQMPEMQEVGVVVISSAMTPSICDRALAAGAIAAWSKPKPIHDFVALLGICPGERID